MSSIIDALESIGVEYKGPNGRSEIRIECPFECCTGRGFKLWINLEKRKYRCWRCDNYGNVRFLLRKLGANVIIDDIAFKPKTEEKPVEIKLPDEYKPILPSPEEKGFLWREAYKYLLEKRHLEPDEVEEYEIGYCNGGDRAGYVILPIRDVNKDLKSWQGRKYYYGSIKALNPTGGTGWLYALDKVNTDTLILVEGPFDTIKINRIVRNSMNAIGLLGHSLSTFQASIIAYKLKPKLVFIMLDPDVPESEKQIASSLVEYGVPDVRLCQMKEKDPDELTEEECLKVLSNARNFSVTDKLVSRPIGTGVNFI